MLSKMCLATYRSPTPTCPPLLSHHPLCQQEEHLPLALPTCRLSSPGCPPPSLSSPATARPRTGSSGCCFSRRHSSRPSWPAALRTLNRSHRQMRAKVQDILLASVAPSVPSHLSSLIIATQNRGTGSQRAHCVNPPRPYSCRECPGTRQGSRHLTMVMICLMWLQSHLRLDHLTILSRRTR